MRYWGSERPSIHRSTRRHKTSSKRQTIASAGSLKNYPFLRKFYQHQAVISGRVQRVFFLLVVASLIYAFVLGDGGIARIIDLRLERGELEENVAELKRNNELLAAEIERLETDYQYIEKIGREKYGYIYSNERVYKIIPIDDRGH